MKRVMMIGSAPNSKGGVASAIKLIRKMQVWEKYDCYWLGTQIQRNYLWKFWYALKSMVVSLFILWRYDIIHFHNATDVNGILIQLPELILAKLFHKKVIIQMHVGNQLESTTDVKLLKWYLNQADLIVLLAKKWKLLFDEKYKDVNVNTTFIYNACDVETDVTFEEKEKIIIMAAWYNENKAADVLLKAWVLLKKKYPDWKLILMGNGDVARYKQLSTELGLADCVSFPGYLVGKEKRDIWRKASIYCMCSYNEGFPMVVLEAWAYGICVVTTPVGGLPDVIDEGINCYTFPFGDYEKLACQLEKLIDDETKRREMSICGSNVMREMFSLESINRSIDNMYQSM